ncbi:Uncharacterised protein [Yersinia intermedia]|uniref:Uncharacterized protein n=1 Tax=Yersinia intermedia TaxID=631 RepID=A0A0T9LYX6_YERIN|nr:Uncharacterised protein [Yersinia intermedia]
MELIMNVNEFLFTQWRYYHFVCFFITFAVFIFFTTIIDIYNDGGLSLFNYSYIVGHLLILIFGLGCFYLSTKKP